MFRLHSKTSFNISRRRVQREQVSICRRGGGGAPCDPWLTNGIIRSGHMGTPPVNGQTDTTENITFPQLRWKTVIIRLNKRL